jgi:hypothetical protein
VGGGGGINCDIAGKEMVFAAACMVTLAADNLPLTLVANNLELALNKMCCAQTNFIALEGNTRRLDLRTELLS